jgi:hypothetical protein
VSPERILALLHAMAAELWWLAFVWHVAVLAFGTLLLAGWRPSLRLGLLLLAAPALSVSIAAFAYRNLFNGISFALLCGALITLGLIADRGRAAAAPRWAFTAGLALIAFGWCYPAFGAHPWYRTLYSAPLGVVPCPTLAMMAGFTIIAAGLRSPYAAAVLAVWTTFYGLFGMARLHVWLDSGLLAATGVLIAYVVVARRPRPSRPRNGEPVPIRNPN